MTQCDICEEGEYTDIDDMICGRHLDADDLSTKFTNRSLNSQHLRMNVLDAPR